MFTMKKIKEFYEALLQKDASYEGLFYVGVKTTGVFCRPTCGARKPKIENCEFFATAKEALLASFRPCLRCQPLSHPNQVSPLIKKLVEAVELNPHKRWKDEDFRSLSIDVSTARRQFKKRFGMTFVEYARARRMGMAMKQIREGNSVIDTQLSIGYESGSGFRDAFSKIMGTSPSKPALIVLHAEWLDTVLGPMLAIADENALYLLEFVERRGLENEIKRMRKKLKAAIIPGENEILKQIKSEVAKYFAGTLSSFKTPIVMLGSTFQKQVWRALQTIPTGETRSYSDIAKQIKRPTACRAVAQANGSNQLAIIIPCHRVINANGTVGGYGGGVARKEWMLEHERKLR